MVRVRQYFHPRDSRAPLTSSKVPFPDWIVNRELPATAILMMR
jgi:hypothetical protein